jgi:hypothetical protein
VVVHTFERVDDDLCEVRIISARRAIGREGAVPREEPMKAEYDFSKGERGRFYRPDAEFSFPIYLEPDVDAYLNELADERDEDVQQLVNEWLRVNIKFVQSVRRAS